MTGLILSMMLACNSSAENPKECESIADGKAKDQCFFDQIAPKTSAEMPQIIETAKKITDPLIRSAAVSAWVRDHNAEITQKQGMELCVLLDGRDRFYCMRRLSSPHLKR